MFPALHTCIPNVPYLGHIYVYNLNKETQQTNKYPNVRGEGEGERLSFLLLNPRYLVFVLEVSMQKGDLQEKVKSMQGKVWYYLTTYLPGTLGTSRSYR